MTHHRFLHPPLEGSLGYNYTEHQLQCMLRHLTASSEIHSPEFDKPCQFINKKIQLSQLFFSKNEKSSKNEREYSLFIFVHTVV